MTAFADRAVLVTGANRGMGREYVSQLLDRGVAKVYAAARDPRTIDATDPRVVPLALDVTDPGSIARAAELADDVSVLINNAGILRGASLLADTSVLRLEPRAHLFGPLALVSAFTARLVQRAGAVVNVASVLSWLPLGGSYGVSKAALWSATDSLRTELTGKGVQVVGVYVGYVDTDMTAAVQAPKSDADAVVRQVLDGVEAGALEVLADELTRGVRAHLNEPISAQLARLVPADA